MILTIITFIVILSVLVFVHELGHFWTARKFGLKPKEFGIGFPPRALGFYKDKEGKWKKVKGRKEVDDASDTIYSVNWFPLGGFVNLGEDEDGGEDPNHFQNKKIWQRAIMISAGVTMNIILAAFLIIVGFWIGLPQSLGDVHPKAQISDQKIQVVEVLEGSPAEAAELKIGDIVLSINDKKIISSEKLQEYNNERTGEELNYKIKRTDEEFAVQITPEYMESINASGVGIGIIETGIVKYPFFLAIWEGIKTTIFITWAIIVAFYDFFKGVFTGQGVGADVAGPVGIAALTGQVARLGFVYILQFAALLSINLAIINFLPIPALDGGRILFLIIEKIKGSPVKRETEAAIHNIGFILLMILIVLVTYKDIARFWQ